MNAPTAGGPVTERLQREGDLSSPSNLITLEHLNERDNQRINARVVQGDVAYYFVDLESSFTMVSASLDSGGRASTILQDHTFTDAQRDALTLFGATTALANALDSKEDPR